MKPIVIFGAGGFAREVLDLIRDINQVEPEWEVLGFVDDNQELWGRSLNNLPVLGGKDWLSSSSTKPYVALGVGSPVVKRKLVLALSDQVAGFPNLIHPTVTISSYVEIGKGVVITAGNILTNQIILDDFVMLNLTCTVGHDSRIGKYTSVSPGSNISGMVTIGEGCDLGTGAKVIQGVTIGEWSVIGAGTVVTKDIPPNTTAVGVPAKVIKERESGWYQ